MGIVYRARDVNLNRDVALKVLPPSWSPIRAGARFVQEAQAAAALEHPHIAVVYEIDEADGVTFIAMELIRGEKLATSLPRPCRPHARSTWRPRSRRARARTREGHRPPRPEARQHHGHRRRPRQGHRLRPRQARRAGLWRRRRDRRAPTTPSRAWSSARRPTCPPSRPAGSRVDHRSDVFCFGICSTRCWPAAPPFRGQTSVDTLHAIL